MKLLHLIYLILGALLLTGCSSILLPEIDPYVVSPIETGPNQYLVVARASDYIGGEPLIRQIAISKANKKCSDENNNLQVIEIQNGRWSKGATIDVYFKCLSNTEKDIVLSESISSRHTIPKKQIQIYKPKLIKSLEGEWFKYAETVSEDYYLLSSIYETSNQTKEVWVLFDLKKSSKYGHGSIKVLYEHQCSNELIQGKTRALKSVSYDGPMGHGKVIQAVHASKNWQNVQPFTMSDERQNIVCN
jgi:hypothetical protein